MHYEGYIKFDIPANETFEYEGLKLINDSDNDFHIFLKKLNFFDGEIIEMEEDTIPIENFQKALDLDHCPSISGEIK
jgi:hypothetical protein